MPAIGDLRGRLRDDGPRRLAATPLEQVRRREHLPDGHALIRIASGKHTRVRRRQRKRWIVGSNERFAVLTREEHGCIGQQRRRAVQAAGDGRSRESGHGTGRGIEHLEVKTFFFLVRARPPVHVAVGGAIHALANEDFPVGQQHGLGRRQRLQDAADDLPLRGSDRRSR